MNDRAPTAPADLYSLLQALGAIALEAGDAASRIDGLAQAIADPASSSLREASGAIQVLRGLLHNVNFLVINVPLGLHRSHKRIFSAILSPESRLPPHREDLIQEDVADVCPVRFIRNQGTPSPGRLEALTARWRSEWATYAELTRRLQARDVLTWNQYLLQGCRRPQPLGLVWGEESGRCSEHYLKVPPGLSGEDWGSEPPSWSQSSVDQPDVLALWRKMEPLPHVNLPDTVGHSIHHLLQSYSIWGGDGFMSVPSQLASAGGDETARAVLSICTSPAMTQDQVIAWQLVADYLFRPVFAVEMLSKYKMQSLVYELGHPLKHRAQRVASLALQARRALSSIVEGEDELVAVRSPEMRRSLDLLEMIECYATAARACGELANIFAACVSAGGWEGLFTKAEWFVEASFPILRPLKQAFELALNKDDARIRARASFDEGCSDYLLAPWLRSRGQVIAPALMIYQHIFSELADNVANHGYCPQGASEVRAEIRIERVPDATFAIVITNLVPTNPENSEYQGPTHVAARWEPVQPGRATGASLAARVLRDLSLGRIERRFVPNDIPEPDTVGHWEVRVLLNGMQGGQQ